MGGGRIPRKKFAGNIKNGEIFNTEGYKVKTYITSELKDIQDKIVKRIDNIKSKEIGFLVIGHDNKTNSILLYLPKCTEKEIDRLDEVIMNEIIKESDIKLKYCLSDINVPNWMRGMNE